MREISQFELFAPAIAPSVVPVGEFLRNLREHLEGRFENVAVQGEISNLSRPASGHIYFTLKDAQASLSAVLFRNEAKRLKFQLQNGQQVILRGHLTVYEPRGQVQLACNAIEPTGVGALALAFEQLKMTLAAEGLFDADRKRPVPTLPRRIGVVTSTSGAAIRDFLRVLHSRFANLPVLIAPARVQGEGAASELVAGIERLVRFSKNAPPGEQLDVIVLTRGGGSIEDLWAFNEEIVARALAACPIPTVSAVGHEVDFTIADFVADLRCPTPTAAAERLAPEKPKELALLDVSKARLAQAVRALVSVESEQVLRLRQRLGDPRRELAAHRLRLEGHASSLQTSALDLLARGREHLSHAKDELYRHHPSEQLQRHERLLRAHREALGQELRQRLVERREQLSALKERLLACSPATEVLKQRGRLLALQKDLGSAQEQLLSGLRLHFEAQASRLDALSPLQVMRRGYAIAFREGRVLRSTEQVRVGDAISVRLSDQGRVQAQVTAVEPPNKTSS